MQCRALQAPTSVQTGPARGHQLDLALDHPRLKGLTPSERQTVVTQLARLMLEARGIADTATQEESDEHA